MNKTHIFLLSAALLCGCTSQENLETDNHLRSDKSFAVTVEDVVSDQTRAHLDGLKVVFDEGDNITVFDNNTAASEYTYSASEEKFAGTSNATGESIEGIFALHPYSASAQYNDGKFEATLPAIQKYEANSFSKNSHIMFGATDDIENGITLKNMSGYIKLQLYSTDETTIKEIKLSTLEEGQIMAGDFYISKGDGEEYALTMYSNDQEHASQMGYVTLDCSEQANGGVLLGDSENPTTFYIAVPAQTYTKGFEITATDIFGREFTKTASTAFLLERNHIKPMAVLEFAYTKTEEDVEIEKEGDHYYVEPRPEHSLEDFLKWAYIVNNINNSLGIKLVGDVNLPKKVITVDEENKTYKYTDTDITIDANGVPSGSNWIPLRNDSNGEYYTNAIIDGNNWNINDMIIKQSSGYAGFIGLMYTNVTVKNLTFNNACVHSTGSEVGIVAGYVRDGTLIDNVHITNSNITGVANVGGIAGRNYRQIKSGVNNDMAVISNCSTDSNTTVMGTSSEIGGICGYNYGAAIIGCVNNADVSGTNNVGGIVGHSRSYNRGKVNAFVIACGSGSDATITATATNNSSGYAGGVIGYTLNDNSNHPDSHSYTTACYSLANIEGVHKGNLIGHAYGNRDVITASWAKNAVSKFVNSGSPTYYSSEQYETAAAITQDIVDAMNTAIDNYNETVEDIQDDAIERVKCHYKWQYNADAWPTLVKDTQN